MFYKDTIRKSKVFRFLFCCLSKLLNRFGMILKSVLRQLPRGKLPPGQLPPRKITPRTVAPPQIVSPEENCPRPSDNCPRGKLTPGKLSPHHEVSFKNNCLLWSKYPQRVLQVNWGKLCIVYEYYNIRVLQLRRKKWFTSKYFLQILTKPCKTPLTREHLSLNASWFSYSRTQKENNFLEKLIRKKMQKILHVK